MYNVPLTSILFHAVYRRVIRGLKISHVSPHMFIPDHITILNFLVNHYHQLRTVAVRVMAAYAESGASFRHRLAEIGFTEAQIGTFGAQQLGSFNAFAFAICGQPGQIDDARFTNVVDTLFPAGRTLGLEANMRQLGYESITIAVAAIRQRVEPAEEGQLKKLPPQERDERMRRQALRITGFSIQGELEPGHAVVDFFTTILEECTIRYLPLSRCISREQEINSLKVDKKIVVLENQQLHVKQKHIEMSVDLSSELKVQNAFIRRGLAAEQAGLLTYSVHERVRRSFMAHLTKQPAAGFKAPDVACVLRADRELWLKVAETCRSDVKVNAAGLLPVDLALERWYQHAEVVFHLLPTPQGKGVKRTLDDDSSDDHADKKKKKKKTKPAKKETNDKFVKVPQSLKGHKGTNAKGARICYNYNLQHGCSHGTHQKDGATRCVKGVHQCIKCHGNHPLHDCDRS